MLNVFFLERASIGKNIYIILFFYFLLLGEKPDKKTKNRQMLGGTIA